MIEFNHFNFNVLNLEKSIAFYKEAIGLSVVREKDSSDGSFKIATRAKSPIIPIAISNSANIWEANFPKMSPTHVVIEYGKPIIPSELDRDTQRHLGAYTQSIIKEMLIKNKELV